MARDLVEPEGVNAGSGEAVRDRPPAGDPVPGGDPAGAARGPEPADRLVGPPPEPAEDGDGVYGSSPPG